MAILTALLAVGSVLTSTSIGIIVNGKTMSISSWAFVLVLLLIGLCALCYAYRTALGYEKERKNRGDKEEEREEKREEREEKQERREDAIEAQELAEKPQALSYGKDHLPGGQSNAASSNET